MIELCLKFLPVLAVLIIYAIRMKEVTTKRSVIKGAIKEKLTFRLFMVSGLITILGGTYEFVKNGYQWSWWTLVLGLACGISSFAIRWSAIAALGKFWSLHNELRDTHEFVQSGPFRWMRHPTYFSMILELLAGVLILSAPVTAVIASLIFIPTLVLRIKKEESLLIQKFGEAYVTYKKHTFAVFPKPPQVLN